MEYYNFGAGPGMLPKEVLEQIKSDIPYWKAGLSVMELGHRTKDFVEIVERSQSLLRELLNIPKGYKIIFPVGGARGQFSMVPLNLMGKKQHADYVLTGYWSNIAYEDASRICTTAIAATSEYSDYRSIPAESTWQINPDAAYLHYTDNESIDGIEFKEIPKVDLPLVCDMTSSILSKPIDVSKFGVIYASAQKNLGIAGITVAIVKEDLIKSTPAKTPPLYDYSVLIKSNSMFNTPATFSWYVLVLVLEWLKKCYIKKDGSLDNLFATNEKKAIKLYDYIDNSNFYVNNVADKFRSRINIPFRIKDKTLEDKFLKFAQDNGIVQIAGHRVSGGMRASMYNAMPEQGVDKLIAVMQEFCHKQ